jgi:hypothetical protein
MLFTDCCRLSYVKVIGDFLRTGLAIGGFSLSKALALKVIADFLSGVGCPPFLGV